MKFSLTRPCPEAASQRGGHGGRGLALARLHPGDVHGGVRQEDGVVEGPALVGGLAEVAVGDAAGLKNES